MKIISMLFFSWSHLDTWIFILFHKKMSRFEETPGFFQEWSFRILHIWSSLLEWNNFQFCSFKVVNNIYNTSFIITHIHEASLNQIINGSQPPNSYLILSTKYSLVTKLMTEIREKIMKWKSSLNMRFSSTSLNFRSFFLTLQRSISNIKL